MKEIRPIFLITYIIGAIAIFSFGCNRTKIPPTENNTQENYSILITLEDDLSGKYISEKYQAYSASDVAKSNKTLNQYEVHFVCSEADFKKLEEELANDTSIINIDDQKSNNNTQSGKNKQYGKSKPIRDKN